MTTTNSQVVIHSTGRKMLSLEAAKAVAAEFRTLGGFSEVGIDEFGFRSGCYSVELWSVNGKAGNRNLTSVCHVPANAKEYKLIAKAAKGKANERDKATLAQIAAEREVERE